jgi:hypothetical protein
MGWSDAQRAQLTREYARIGYVPGELWPAPPLELTPDDLLALCARIADGAGREGYVAELGKLARG